MAKLPRLLLAASAIFGCATTTAPLAARGDDSHSPLGWVAIAQVADDFPLGGHGQLAIVPYRVVEWISPPRESDPARWPKVYDVPVSLEWFGDLDWNDFKLQLLRDDPYALVELTATRDGLAVGRSYRFEGAVDVAAIAARERRGVHDASMLHECKSSEEAAEFLDRTANEGEPSIQLTWAASSSPHQRSERFATAYRRALEAIFARDNVASDVRIVAVELRSRATRFAAAATEERRFAELAGEVLLRRIRDATVAGAEAHAIVGVLCDRADEYGEGSRLAPGCVSYHLWSPRLRREFLAATENYRPPPSPPGPISGCFWLSGGLLRVDELRSELLREYPEAADRCDRP